MVTGDDTALRSSVENVELLGHERHVVCRVGDSLFTVRQPNDTVPPTVGDDRSVWRSVPSGVHLFDTTSTERVN